MIRKNGWILYQTILFSYSHYSIILLFRHGFQFGVIIRDKNGYKMHFGGLEPEEIN